jgi:hypothetical protein
MVDDPPRPAAGAAAWRPGARADVAPATVDTSLTGFVHSRP